MSVSEFGYKSFFRLGPYFFFFSIAENVISILGAIVFLIYAFGKSRENKAGKTLIIVFLILFVIFYIGALVFDGEAAGGLFFVSYGMQILLVLAVIISTINLFKKRE